MGALFFNTQPILIGALAEAFSYTEVELGRIAGFVLVAAFMVLLASLYLVQHYSWRRIVWTGASIACLGSIGLMFATTFQGVLASLTLIGAGGAATFAVCLATLSMAPNPTRAFGIAVSMQVMVAALVVFLVPSFAMPRYGFAGVATLLLVVNAAALTIAPTLQTHQSSGSHDTERAPLPPHTMLWVFVGLSAIAVMFVGLNGAWSFAERIGASMSLSGDEIGQGLALALVLGATGSLTASIVGDRIKVTTALTISVVGFLVFVLLARSPNATNFALAFIVFNLAWNFTLPYQMSVIAALSNHHIVLVPAVQTIGGALGPVSAGTLYISVGVFGIYSLLMISVVAAFAAYVFILRFQASQVELAEPT